MLKLMTENSTRKFLNILAMLEIHHIFGEKIHHHLNEFLQFISNLTQLGLHGIILLRNHLFTQGIVISTSN